jgi:hypothetical protein
MVQISHQMSSRTIVKDWNQIEICICSTSEDKRASQKSQWPNMQWDKETAVGTP